MWISCEYLFELKGNKKLNTVYNKMKLRYNFFMKNSSLATNTLLI